MTAHKTPPRLGEGFSAVISRRVMSLEPENHLTGSVGPETLFVRLFRNALPLVPNACTVGESLEFDSCRVLL